MNQFPTYPEFTPTSYPTPTSTPNTIRVRHYSQSIQRIRSDMMIRTGNHPFFIWIESPILTSYNERAIQEVTESFYVPLNKRGGFVEFNVDTSKWPVEGDPNLPDIINAKIINLWDTAYIMKGFPLAQPDTNAVFYDWKGGLLSP